MNSATFLGLAAVSTASGLCALFWVLYESVLKKHARLTRRVSDSPRQDAAQTHTSMFRDLQRFRAGTVSRAAAGWRSFRRLVDQSGLELAPTHVVAAAAGGAVGAWLFSVSLAVPWWMSAALFVLAGALPFLFVVWRRRRRIDTLRRQLPEAFDLMRRSVHGGQTVESAFHLVATDMSAPLGEEFAYCCEQQHLGLDYTVSLRELANRTGVLELQMFTVGMLVQRQSGGNPVELLNNLAEIVRKRIQMESRVRALTAEGRLQAIVLALLPVAAFVAVYFLDREYARILIARPKVMLATAASVLLGVMWIRKIVKVDY